MTEEVVYDDSRKVTCKEAADLLRQDKVIKVWFRPDGILNHNDPDNDPAFIWLEGP